MIQEKISLTDLKQNLGDVVNRAAYGNRRILLLARGKARAALISIEDLHRFEQLEQNAKAQTDYNTQLALLDDAREFRALQTQNGKLDTSDILNEIREGRVDDLTHLR